MQVYTKLSEKILQNDLYHSCVHDATVEYIKWDCASQSLSIRMKNEYAKEAIHFLFSQVRYCLYVKGKQRGDSTVVSSLTVEKIDTTTSPFPAHISNCTPYLYLLLQMFSGDEWHILCDAVTIDDI